MKEHVTYSNAEPVVLTQKDVVDAIRQLREIGKLPYVVNILTQEKLEDLWPKSPTVRTFMYGGIPIHESSIVPKGILRFVMSDGKTQDFPAYEVVKLMSN